MADWTPITRRELQVIGDHPDYPGLLQVVISLSEEPPEKWQEFFMNPTGVGISMSMHPPEISGGEIGISPPDNELERYVRHVDERIDAANQRYSREVLPQITLQEQRDEMSRRDDEECLAKARASVKKL
ncbi:MAG: hypothetical protein ACYDC3_06890 [Candidatus Binataceae bacterium]